MTEQIQPRTAQALVEELPDTAEKLRQIERLLGEAFGDVGRAEPRDAQGYLVLPIPDAHQDALKRLHLLREGVEELLYPVAAREWHTEARVRVLEDCSSRAVDPPLTRRFRAGEELRMVQWGRAGRLVKRDSWWDSYDIDGAAIIPADKVEVLEVLDEVSPEEVL